MKRLEEDLYRIFIDGDEGVVIRLSAIVTIRSLEMTGRINNELHHYDSKSIMNTFRTLASLSDECLDLWSYETLLLRVEYMSLNMEFNLQNDLIPTVVSKHLYEYNNVRKILQENDYVKGDDFDWRLYNLKHGGRIPKQMYLENVERLHYIRDFISQVNPEYMEFRKGDYTTYGDLLKAGVTHEYIYKSMSHIIKDLNKNEAIGFVEFIKDEHVTDPRTNWLRDYLKGKLLNE